MSNPSENHEGESAAQQPDAALQPDPPRRPGAAANALDLWGFTRSPGMQFVALAVCAAFVVLEGGYNIELLNTLIDPNSSREVIQTLSDRGKLLAAIGLSWACGRFLLERIRPALLGVAVLAMLATAVYHGLDHLYTRVIHDLPASVKLEGYSLFGYRQDLLTGKLFDPDIPLPKDEPVAARIVMGAFPIVLLDERFMLPVRDIMQRKAEDKTRFVLKDAAEAWPGYDRQMQDLNAGYREFIDGSRQAYQYRAMGGIERFRQKSGGLEPAPSMSRDQFVDMLRKSSHPRGQALRQAESREIAQRTNGTVVRAGDVPKFMNRASYMAWFEAQVKAERDAAMPTEATVERVEGIHDINSAIFLPPMAMIASLTSALTNALTFALLALSALATRSRVPVLERAGRLVARFASPIMLLLFATLLIAMPSHVFKPGPMHDLEDKLHRKVGLPGQVWSRLSNVQVLFLQREIR